MSLRVAIQMDPMESIRPETDSTFLLMEEAQVRGYKLWHYTPDKISYTDGNITAQARPLKLTGSKPFYRLGKPQRLEMNSLDVVLIRQNPPYDMAYATNTYLLEMLHPKPLVVNHPASVRNNPEKLFPLLFKQFMPPTLITSDLAEAQNFRKKHKDVVVKPLYGFSGHSVFRLHSNDSKSEVLIKRLFASSKETWVVQKFLPEMRTEERRLLFVNGELSGVLSRIPGEGQMHAGFQSGAQYLKARITPRQKKIAAALGPELKKKGFLYAGADVIGDWLTEINVTSPGSLRGMVSVYGIHLEKKIWDAIEKSISRKR